MIRGKKIRRSVNATLLAGVAVFVLLPAAALAKPQNFNVPAGDATITITKIAIDSGLQILAPNDALKGIKTKTVRGSYEPIDALRKMLAGTGLVVQRTGPDAVTVTRPATFENSDEGASLPNDTLADEEVQIIVTGSRIQRAGIDTLQAASTTDAEEVERRGYTNALEALQDTPGFAPAANSQIGTSQGNLGIAQSFANFFGLGSQRTLTLVNGRRFVSSNTVSGTGGATSPGSQVDLNLIPVGLIDRIETIAIGGAPVYGSDAIAGTVNIILKDNFDGLQITGQTSISDRGDAANQTVRGLFGHNFNDDRGNIVVGAEYVRQEGMVLADRFPFRFLTPSGNTDPGDGISAQQVVDALRYAPLTDGGLPYAAAVPFAPTYIRNSAGDPVMFGPNGDLVPYTLGSAFFGSSAGPIPIFTDGGDGLDPAKYTSLLSPNERYLLNVTGNYDVTDRINLFVEGSYAHTSGTKISDLYQFAAPGILGGPALSLDVNNAFLNDQARSVLVANGLTSFQLNRNFNDIVDRKPAKSELDVYRIVVGAKGDLDLGEKTWTWDVAYNYGYSRNRSQFNQINLTRFLQAIDAVRDSSGNIVCASGGDCVPLNIFGEGVSSPEAVAYVVDEGIGISKNSMHDFTANIGGQLPFGIAEDIALNVGYEHREETGSFDANTILNGGLSILGGALPFPDAPKAGFNTDEFYGETIVPLIRDAMDVPLVKTLQAEGAIRYVHHSITGGDITWSAGARLEPRLGGIGEGITLRGVYTKSIRSPSLVELFLNTTPVARAGNDLCAASRVNSGSNPEVRYANCQEALAAVGAGDPNAFNATTNGASPFGALGGNQNLDNEKASSYSFGLVYQPPAIPGLRASVDYSHIKLRNAISQFTLGTAQAACYDSPNFPDEGACSAFRRLDAAEAAAQSAATGRQRIAGDIADGYLESYFNSASLDFAGIIGEISYAFAVPNIASSNGPGRLRLGVKAFYTDHYRSQTSGASPVVETAGTLGTPRWKVNGRIGYAFDPFDWDVQVLWNDKTVGDLALTLEDTPVNKYPSYTLVNTTFGAQVNDRFSLQFTVRNLFDRKVPFPATVSRAFSVYDPIGRVFMVRASMNF